MRIAPLVILFALSVAALPGAEDFATAGRAIGARHAGAIVPLRVVSQIKLSAMGQAQNEEQESDAVAVLVDAEGFYAVPASTLDPTVLVQSMLKRMAGAQAGMMKLESHLKELLLVLPDGLEVRADVVVKDADLDLAIIKSREKPKSAAVPLDRSAAPQALDDIVLLGRSSRGTGAALTLRRATISARVEGPQPYWLTDGAVPVGQLACAADGAVVGLIALRIANEGAPTGGGQLAGLGMLSAMTSGEMPGMAQVVRPAAAIVRLLAQAKSGGAGK